jgi:Fe-S oxidoreductase
MLRAKAYEFKSGKGTHRTRDKLLSSTDLGRFAAIPIVAQAVNTVGKSKPAREMGEKMLAIDRDAWVPSYSPHKFTSTAPRSKEHPVREGTRAPGKVAIFATCYVNYNEPAIGHDLLKILDHNEVPYVLAHYNACCGMPKLELGDLESVAKLKERNIPALAKLAREGYAIMTPVPSCTLMFKQEIPLMFPDDPDVKAVRDAAFDPFEYLMARHRDGLFKTDFKQPLGKVAYHVPCHTRVQKMGLKTREALEAVPGTEVLTIERCSGHAGTWGVKAEYHDTALKIGRPVMRQIADFGPDYFASDCELAGHHLEEGVGDNKGRARLRHPITLLRIAYGLPD